MTRGDEKKQAASKRSRELIEVKDGAPELPAQPRPEEDDGDETDKLEALARKLAAARAKQADSDAGHDGSEADDAG